MRFEETVEEANIVEAQREGYLFDLQVCNLQLRLCVCEQCVCDDVASGPLAHGFDGGTEVRQGDVHSVRVLVHMVPLLVVLQHKLAVVLINLCFAVLRS